MTAIELYKFINENDVEWHREEIDGQDNVIIFPSIYNIEDFNKLLKGGILDESGIKCRMKDRYFCFWMKDICEYFGIDLNEIFPKEQKSNK